VVLSGKCIFKGGGVLTYTVLPHCMIHIDKYKERIGILNFIIGRIVINEKIVKHERLSYASGRSGI